MIAFGYALELRPEGRQVITSVRLGTVEAGKATHELMLAEPLDDIPANRPPACAEWDETAHAGELVAL